MAVSCGVTEISLPYGRRVLIDEADFPLIAGWKWTAGTANRYAVARDERDNNNITMHRIIMGLPPLWMDPRQVDHINGDGLDNRRENLRLCTRQQNQWNRGARANSAVGLKGVSKDGKKFAARIKINGRTIRLGKFATPEEAHKVYCDKLTEIAGEFARFK